MLPWRCWASAARAAAGFVINDLIAPSLGAEIAREVRRFRRFRPRLADRLAAWAESLPLFNLPA